MKQVIKITFTYEYDTDTGEMKVLNTQLFNEKTEIATVTRQKNKITLNEAALNYMGLKVGDRIEVGYRNNGESFPVIYKSDKGNKITKSRSVAFRGVVNDDLAKYGDEFNVEVFADDIYRLMSETVIKEEELVDPLIEVPDIEDRENTLDDELNELLDSSLEEENNNSIYQF